MTNSTTDLAFIDTNVLVYMFDGDDTAKRDVARHLYRDRAPGGTLVLSAQILGEFYVTVTRKLARPLDAALAAEVVRDLSALPFVSVSAATVAAAVARSRSDTLSYGDALLVETARAGGCSEILTEDLQDGRDFDGVRITNPFRR